MTRTQLKVTSHVARDLLSSAAAFKNEAAAVWEYVANSLQYLDPGVSPVVQVTVDTGERWIRVSDNGRGMSVDELQHFFTMHGENLERLAGRPGRGKFGTGKAAAFGIGNKLTLETVSNRKRNVVELTRATIDKSSGDKIPVNWIADDEDCAQPNGTIVTISDIFVARLRTNEIIDYIERHLQVFRARQPSVAVNDHVCEYRPPELLLTRTFTPTPAQAKVIGDCNLTIHVARVPLSDLEQGVFVTAGAGNLVGREDCGVGHKEFGNYLYGEIDVPALETFETPIQPYDDSRSLKLNPEHPVVRILVGFLGSKLDEVRQEQVRSSREAHRSEQMRRLAQEADRIADFLNQDFRFLKERLDQIRAASASKGPAKSLFGAAPEGAGADDAWVKGTSERGEFERSVSPLGDGEGKGRKPPDLTAAGHRNPSGKKSVDPVGGDGPRRRARGGFEVRYDRLGLEEQRSKYDRTSLAILINLDHAAVANALKATGSEDPIFRRLSYEIAFSEYAMALGYELARQDPDMPADDLLYEVRATLNRVSKAAASLYLA
jgi:Histidine kinase-, DNA gyrase B-, and HSP90-like ATPase